MNRIVLLTERVNKLYLMLEKFHFRYNNDKKDLIQKFNKKNELEISFIEY